MPRPNQTTLELSPRLRERLKLYCVVHDRSMSQVMRDLLTEHLDAWQPDTEALARARVLQNPSLRPYAGLLLEETFLADHALWVLDAPEEELLAWCRETEEETAKSC